VIGRLKVHLGSLEATRRIGLALGQAMRKKPAGAPRGEAAAPPGVGPDAGPRAGAALDEGGEDTGAPPVIVLLAGEMGSGKTTLVKAVCEGLGIDPRIVISPTYTLVNVYPGPRSVYHVDLFRLERPEALLELDREDWVNPRGPTLVEWPEAARPLLLGEPVLEATLRLVPGQPNARELELRGEPTLHGALLAAVLAAADVARRQAENPSGHEPA
jgi:tRNA threonylcarbamoyladenosine biosynthesis protein TsaE